MVSPARDNFQFPMSEDAIRKDACLQAVETRKAEAEFRNLQFECSLAAEEGNIAGVQACVKKMDALSERIFESQRNLISDNITLKRQCSKTTENLHECMEKLVVAQEVNQTNARANDERVAAILRETRSSERATGDAADTVREVAPVTWTERLQAYCDIAAERLRQAWPHIMTGVSVLVGLGGLVLAIVNAAR